MKNIVICCDGTGNEFGSNNTNVVETYSLAHKSDQQLAFYDPGVGTGGWDYDEGLGVLRAKADQVTGNGLQKNVEDAYHLLMNTWEPDDKIYLFGFSRGAFTARSVAGMLHKCGLLRDDSHNLVEYVSKIYNTKKNAEVAADFKDIFCRPCPVHFIGVWDTVESLLMNAGKKWHDATLNPEVASGYHAVSIDERRKDFPPALWDEASKASGQTIEQVWFAGVHSDVGGWYDERGLSNAALQWMLGRAKACGMQIDEVGLAGKKPNPHDEIHESFKGFWKFRRSRTRKIPEGASIHASVLKRMGEPRNNYKPKNLPDHYKTVE